MKSYDRQQCFSCVNRYSDICERCDIRCNKYSNRKKLKIIKNIILFISRFIKIR